MDREQLIIKILQEELSPTELVVQDDSQRHLGHAGARPEGKTHFTVRIVAEKFAGKSRIERQRMVNSALQELFTQGLHALSVTAKAPDEI